MSRECHLFADGVRLWLRQLLLAPGELDCLRCPIGKFCMHIGCNTQISANPIFRDLRRNLVKAFAIYLSCPRRAKSDVLPRGILTRNIKSTNTATKGL